MRSKIFLLIFILVFACKSNENQPEFEKKPVEPDPFKRAKDYLPKEETIKIQPLVLQLLMFYGEQH